MNTPTSKSNRDPSRNSADTSRRAAAEEWSRQNDEQRSTRAASQDPQEQSAAAPRTGQQRDESGQSGAQRAAQRTTRPGHAGLANEVRPGLGTRAETREDEGKDGASLKAPDVQRAASDGGQTTKRPEPREQRSDSLAQEQQRSTGVSGMSSGT